MKKISMHITLVFWIENNEKLLVFVLISLYLSGCVLTKVVTVPMRVTGSVISVIPVVGDGIDEVLNQSADIIDAIPI